MSRILIATLSTATCRDNTPAYTVGVIERTLQTDDYTEVTCDKLYSHNLVNGT